MVEAGAFEEPPARVGGRAIRPGGEASVDVARADAQLEHHRGIARLGELEALLHGAHHRRQTRAGVEKPHLGLHREGVASLLDDARAVAVVLADHDERAAGDPGGREVRERVGGDVGAHGGLPHGAAAHRVVDRSGEHRAGRRLVRTGLDVDPERIEDLAGVVEDIHHVGDRRPLIAANVGHAGLEQRLGDREDALAVEYVALAEPESPNLLRKASFRHVMPPRDARSPGAFSGIIGIYRCMKYTGARGQGHEYQREQRDMAWHGRSGPYFRRPLGHTTSSLSAQRYMSAPGAVLAPPARPHHRGRMDRNRFDQCRSHAP